MVVVPVVLGFAVVSAVADIGGFHGTYRLRFRSHDGPAEKPDGTSYPRCTQPELDEALSAWTPLEVVVDHGLVVNGERFWIDGAMQGRLDGHSTKNPRIHITFFENRCSDTPETPHVAFLYITAHLNGRDCASTDLFLEASSAD